MGWLRNINGLDPRLLKTTPLLFVIHKTLWKLCIPLKSEFASVIDKAMINVVFVIAKKLSIICLFLIVIAAMQ